MITYPVDPSTRWATINTDTGEIIARNKPWPVLDGTEIIGLDENIVLLLHVDSTPPPYDSRFYTMTVSEIVDVPNNELRRNYAAVKRPVEEQKIAAENVEITELSKHISLQRELIETRLVVSAILQFISGLDLPPKIQTMTDAYKSKGVKLWKNRDRLKAILADIEAGQEPDLDAGWELPDE